MCMVRRMPGAQVYSVVRWLFGSDLFGSDLVGLWLRLCHCFVVLGDARPLLLSPCNTASKPNQNWYRCRSMVPHSFLQFSPADTEQDLLLIALWGGIWPWVPVLLGLFFLLRVTQSSTASLTASTPVRHESMSQLLPERGINRGFSCC